jgi:Bifunctional DNA primase/polymerase, N-terminal
MSMAARAITELDDILRLAARAWRLHPCKARDKKPHLKSWPDKATCDPSIIQEWSITYPDCAWGVKTGADSGVWVLDCDGDKGLSSLDELIKIHGEAWLQTLTAITPNGRHFYFQYPTDAMIRNSVSRLRPRLDVRGEGGYVIAPPSLHPSGRQYRWVNPEAPVISTPEWLLQLLASLTSSQPNTICKAERQETLSEAELREIIDRVLDLHRHGDAMITFGRKDAKGALKHTDSFRASSFETIFPPFLAEFLQDGHVAINAAIAAGALRFELPSHTNPVKKGRSFHREEYLRRLNACYVDVDCYKLEPRREPDDVLEDVDSMCAAGDLPRPTTVIKSGRGFWLLWHLHDTSDPKRSHLGCQADVIMRYKEINRAFGAKLAHIGVDRGAVDAARLTGLHGTFKTKSQKKVVWSSYPGGRSYTLAELGNLLNVIDTRSQTERDALYESGREKRTHRRMSGNSIPAEVSERCRRGWRKSASNRIACFSALKSIRGGFNEGMRDRAMFVYAGCLRSACYSEDAARGLVRQMGASDCSPAFNQSDCDVRVRSAYSKLLDKAGKLTRRRPCITYEWMANQLEVAVEEAFEISQIVQTTFPPQSGSGSVVHSPGRDEKKLRRQENILAIMRVYGSVFSFAEILQQLAERGTPACKGTLHNDFKELGLQTPKMQPKQKTLAPRTMRLALAV